MTINWPLIGIAAVNLTFSTASDTCAKLWSLPGGGKWLYIGMAISIFTTFTFMAVVRSGGLAVGASVVLVLTIILNVGIGFLIFNEAVTPGQWVGIALGVFAILLISDLIPLPI